MDTEQMAEPTTAEAAGRLAEYLGGLIAVRFLIFSGRTDLAIAVAAAALVDAAMTYPEWGKALADKLFDVPDMTPEMRVESAQALVRALPISAVNAAPGEHAGEMYEG